MKRVKKSSRRPSEEVLSMGREVFLFSKLMASAVGRRFVETCGKELNDQEVKVLAALFCSASDNGYDFGISNSILPESLGLNGQQYSGYISDLEKKGFILCYGNVNDKYTATDTSGPVHLYKIEEGAFARCGLGEYERMPLCWFRASDVA